MRTPRITLKERLLVNTLRVGVFSENELLGSGADGVVVSMGDKAVKMPYPSLVCHGIGAYEVGGIREAAIHEDLYDAGVSVPTFYGTSGKSFKGYDRSPCIVMERVDGSHIATPSGNVPAGVPNGAVLDVTLPEKDTCSFIRKLDREIQRAESAGYVPSHDLLYNVLNRSGDPVIIDFVRWRREQENGPIAVETEAVSYLVGDLVFLHPHKRTIKNNPDFDTNLLDQLSDGERIVRIV